MEGQVTEVKKNVFKIVMKTELIINYDQPVSEIALPKKVRDVNRGLYKVKIEETGEKPVVVVLIDLGPEVCHKTAKMAMEKAGISQAGVHEIVHFASVLPDLPETKFYISSLREESKHGPLELVPTICVYGKNSVNISLGLRDDLPLLKTYFLGIEDN
ncbi:MAG: hypothetical protein WCK59_01265 [Candidatus Falkowbacteria bacterium]